MKTKPTIVITLLAIAGVTFLFANSEKETPQFNLSGSTSSGIEERLTKLEEKVSMLEKENYKLMESILNLESVTITPDENWKKKEFNGETLYIKPVIKE